jgi:hypothetical protein
MKRLYTYCIVVLLLMIYTEGSAQKTYTIISKKGSMVNRAAIKQLTPSLRALAAYYSAVGGTKCKELSCELTTALGLGSQGSEEQKELIQKYFPDDKVAQMICGQNCYLPPENSLSYSDFEYLSFTVNGENVLVNYRLIVYNRGATKTIDGPDMYTYDHQVFKDKKRVLYSWVNK